MTILVLLDGRPSTKDVAVRFCPSAIYEQTEVEEERETMTILSWPEISADVRWSYLFISSLDCWLDQRTDASEQDGLKEEGSS